MLKVAGPSHTDSLVRQLYPCFWDPFCLPQVPVEGKELEHRGTPTEQLRCETGLIGMPVIPTSFNPRRPVLLGLGQKLRTGDLQIGPCVLRDDCIVGIPMA